METRDSVLDKKTGNFRWKKHLIENGTERDV